MADGPALSLQKALIAALRSAASVTDHVGSRVFDEPLASVAFPHIRLGPFDVAPLRLDCAVDHEIDFVIEVHSRPVAGRVEATRVIEAVRTVLDDADLNVDGFNFEWCFFQTQTVRRQDDGHSYLGRAVFRAAMSDT